MLSKKENDMYSECCPFPEIGPWMLVGIIGGTGGAIIGTGYIVDAISRAVMDDNNDPKKKLKFVLMFLYKLIYYQY